MGDDDFVLSPDHVLGCQAPDTADELAQDERPNHGDRELDNESGDRGDQTCHCHSLNRFHYMICNFCEKIKAPVDWGPNWLVFLLNDGDPLFEDACDGAQGPYEVFQLFERQKH